jgi:excinuclease ABC subunit C
MFSSDDVFDLDSFLKNLTTHPGVYRMYNKARKIIYIGKARNLHKRINSYFNKETKELKTQALVRHIAYIDITVTPSDYEAYLLESSLIKQHRPHYNIVFKDDKSYPYLVISDHDFPRLYGFRGKVHKKGTFFGPYVSLASMRDALVSLQKLFPIRQCQDSYFSNRSRPCLQYQIKRCTAPCVGKISQQDYEIQVSLLKRFIQGKLSDVLGEISDKMHQAALDENFEQAAQLRDQLVLLRKLQQQQIIDRSNHYTCHVLGIVTLAQSASIALLSINQGKLTDDKHWLIECKFQTDASLLEAFLAHYYLADEYRTLWPNKIILPAEISLPDALLSAINKKANKNIQWITNASTDNAKWQQLAMVNARQKLQMSLQSAREYTKRMNALEQWLDIENIQRIECFDISHHQGEATVASCVVYNRTGPVKTEYRRYNIRNITAGDDYAAMTQAVTRRIDSGIEANNLPCVIIIDGGKGQLNQAEMVLDRFSLRNEIQLLALSKGVDRVDGKEAIYKGFDKTAYHLPAHHLGFLLLRQIRDAAHDFAIKGQRKKSLKNRKTSVIESIPGIGHKRRKALLSYFGDWQELAGASVEEIAKVQGVSFRLASEIWQAFR